MSSMMVSLEDGGRREDEPEVASRLWANSMRSGVANGPWKRMPNAEVVLQVLRSRSVCARRNLAGVVEERRCRDSG